MRGSAHAVSVLLLLLAVNVAAGSAQEPGRVTGTVVAQDGQPIEGAQVSVVGTALGALTNAQGRYLILNVPPGDRTLRVRVIGYGEGSARLSVRPGEAVVQDFRLEQQAVALRGVTVIGSRAARTAANELPVPVDVYTETEIVTSGQPEMLGVLEELSPSIYFPKEQISDVASGIRPFQLRGLSPDHALVLLNAKRRHSTASVQVFGNSMPGATGVDMNAIPPLAIEQIEVLRDGAAAQYGSDAIAGVLNLQLKNDVSPLIIDASAGRHFPDDFSSDGLRYDLAAHQGFGIGRGVLAVTGQYGYRAAVDRAGPDPRDQLVNENPGLFDDDGDQVADVDGDGVNEVVGKRNGVRQPNHLWGDGWYWNRMLFANFEHPLSRRDDGPELYVFGGISKRTDLHSGFYRRAVDGRNWPQIYPLGFLPQFDADTRDAQLTTGVRGEWGEWRYDVGGQWGQNRVDIDITNTHNASLGPCLDVPCAPGADRVLGTSDDPGIPNQKKVYAGSIEASQILGTIELGRTIGEIRGSPLNLAVGAHFRADNFKIVPGEKASWVNGFHPNQHGGVAAAGSQVFPGYLPRQETDEWRTNIATYAETEADLGAGVLANVAARFENYSDFGSTVTGKLAVRFQPMEQLILRASASTGFRAPGIQQSWWAHTSTGFQTDPATGNQVAFEIGEFPVESDEARALGARPLQEERSRNLAAGFAFSPTPNLHFTVDGYRVDIADAIILSGTLSSSSSDRIRELLRPYQASAIKYFTNAIDLRASGADFTGRYRRILGGEHFVEFFGAFNLSRIEITDGPHTPAVIEGLGDRILSEGERTEIEEERPRERGLAKVLYNVGRLQTTVATRFYGEVKELQDATTDFVQTYRSKGVLDAEATYRFLNGLTLSVGGENLLDAMPTPIHKDYNFFGIFPYPQTSIGMSGRYLYAKARITL